MIGNFTFSTACHQYREWCQKYGEAIKIGLNLSGREFEQPNLVEKIRAVIESEKVDPKYIEIEVTETAVMTNIQSAIDVLEQFRKLGIQFSIDDFGAG